MEKLKFVSASWFTFLMKHTDLEGECRRDVLCLFEANSEAKLLDLGCSSGEFTSMIARRVATKKVFGIEVVIEDVEEAMARGIDCYQADLDGAEFPFEDGSFDVVNAKHVIEHLGNTDTFLTEMWRVLRLGGYAVISTPNLAAWHSIAYLSLGLQPHHAQVSDKALGLGSWYPDGKKLEKAPGPHHRRIFTLGALRDLLEYHGFKVERCTGSGFFPLPAPLARLACRIDKRHANYITVKARKNHPKLGTGR